MELSREIIEFFFGGLLTLTVSIHFFKSLSWRKNITLIDISVWITGISFGLAPFILVLSGGYFPEAKTIGVVFSYAGLFLFITGLLLIKKIFYRNVKKSINLKIFLEKVNIINTREVFFFYISFFIIRLIFAFDYGIFGSGSATSERMASLPYLLFVSRSLLDLTFFGTLLWSVTKILYNKKFFPLPTIILIIETILIFFSGRRQMLYFVFLFIYIYILLGYRINLKILVPSSLIIIILVNVIFPAFISFREIALSTTSTGGIIQEYKTSYNLLLETGVDKESYESNVAERVYINAWNINILNKRSLIEGLNGQALAMCVLWAVPRPLLPFKGTLKDPELLISYTYGLSLTDSPSNWPAYGFADFGLLGGLIYGIILGLILFLFQKFAIYNFNRYPFYSFVIIGSVLFLAFFIEESPIAVFSVMRDTIILFVVFYLIRVFSANKVKIRSQLQKG